MKKFKLFLLHKYEYLFFDFDGVILDSLPIKTDAFRELYMPYGNDVARKVVAHHSLNGGMSRFEKFRLYHRDYIGIQLTEQEVHRLAAQFADLVYEKVMRAPFIKGAREFLELCREREKHCFCVSGTPEDEIKRVIQARGLMSFFRDIKGSPCSKTDNVRELIKNYDVISEHAVFFGDAINDLKAAQQNNIEFIGINYTGAETGFKNFEQLLQGCEGI